MKYDAVVIGASWGGINALKVLLSELPIDFLVPVFVVQHLLPEEDSYLVTYLKENTSIEIKDPNSLEKIVPSVVFIAPPNYHMLLEKTEHIVLSVEEKVNYSRPSIDLLFLSAAEVYKEKLIGVVLTGANSDGSVGLKRIKELGGFTIVQDPKQAEAGIMPKAAIKSTEVDYVLNIEEIGQAIKKLIYG